MTSVRVLVRVAQSACFFVNCASETVASNVGNRLVPNTFFLLGYAMTVQINRSLYKVSTNHVSMNLAAVKMYVHVSNSEKFSSKVLEKTPRRNLKIVNKDVEE